MYLSKKKKEEKRELHKIIRGGLMACKNMIKFMVMGSNYLI